MPAHLPAMILAELRAIFGRASGKALLVISLVIGIVAAAGMLWVHQRATTTDTVPVINGMPITAMLDFSAQATAGWALRARNFYVLPVLLLLSAASSLAGELGDRTLREVLVRPVPRWSVLAAKLSALLVLSICSHLLTLAPSLGGGAVLGFESKTPLPDLLLGYLASVGSDVGILLIGFAASVFFQSVGAVVVAVLLALMADGFLQLVLWGIDKLGVAWAATAGQMLPGNALACWEGWSEGWEPSKLAGLGVLWLVCAGVALARFQRMDVP